MYAAITGWGMYVPERVLTNAEIEQMVDTSDEWIMSRTGIRERRIAAPQETTATMGAAAGRQALERAGCRPDEIDLVICATSSPDMQMPSTACIIQTELGIPRAAAFDVQAACSGFLYAAGVASSMLRTGPFKRALVIGSDTFSRYINWQDRNTCVLFGDAAGAAVLEASELPSGVLAYDLGSIPETHELLKIKAGGSRHPASAETVARNEHTISMEGREVFKYAVRAMEESALKVLSDAGVSMDEVRIVVPHQANIRILEALAKRLQVPMERVFANIDRYGNTSAATVPVALCEAYEAGHIHDGDYVLMTAFGSGLTWASALIRWGGRA